ncbi:hypothetical protein J6Z19_09520, partial [bacterium]|nr:hypothetical protein [bacterium]
MQLHLKAFLVVLGLIFLVSCSSSHSSNDTDILPDTDDDMQDIETDDEDFDFQDTDFIDDYDKTDGEDSDSENDEDLPDEANSLTQECFGKKVLTKEIVEIDWQGDGFENGVGFDYSYQIDRYYDKNCRVKF